MAFVGYDCIFVADFFSLFLSLLGSSMGFFVSGKTEMIPNDFELWFEYLDQIQVCYTEFFENRTTYGNNIARVFTVSIQTVTFLRQSYVFFFSSLEQVNEEKRAKRDREKERQDNKMKKETMKHRPQNRTNEWDAKTVMQTTKYLPKYQINNLFFWNIFVFVVSFLGHIMPIASL